MELVLLLFLTIFFRLGEHVFMFFMSGKTTFFVRFLSAVPTYNADGVY